MHNFSGKWDPQILPWICFPIWRIKMPPFFWKIAHALKKNAQTNRHHHHNKQTKQQTNQERKKQTNQQTNQARKKERKKQTNQPNNQLAFTFSTQKNMQLLCFAHVVQQPSSRTPPPSTTSSPPPCHRHGWQQKLHQRPGSAPHPCKARWLRQWRKWWGFNHQKSIKKSMVSTMEGSEVLRFFEELCVVSVFWMICCLEFQKISW